MISGTIVVAGQKLGAPSANDNAADAADAGER
jgi:hypothetical protein